jgi:hypothetical protein
VSTKKTLPKYCPKQFYSLLCVNPNDLLKKKKLVDVTLAILLCLKEIRKKKEKVIFAPLDIGQLLFSGYEL